MKSQTPTHRTNRIANFRLMLALTLAIAALVLVVSPRQLVSALRGQPSLVPDAACTAPPAGMVGWWPGENNANDIKGASNGTLQGSVTFPAGEVGQAFGLNGSDQKILIGNPAS